RLRRSGGGLRWLSHRCLLDNLPQLVLEFSHFHVIPSLTSRFQLRADLCLPALFPLLRHVSIESANLLQRRFRSGQPLFGGGELLGRVRQLPLKLLPIAPQEGNQALALLHVLRSIDPVVSRALPFRLGLPTHTASF